MYINNSLQHGHVISGLIQLKMAVVMQALGFSMPQFGHVSLILAPDRSKLSKRHGATSVGQVLLLSLV